MKFSRTQLVALGTGLTVGGVVLKTIDANNTGAEDRAGQALTTAGAVVSQLGAGETVTKKAKAAEALRAVGTALSALADEVEAEE